MHVFLSKKYLKSPDLTSPCTEELLPYDKTKDPGLLLYPKFWFLCLTADACIGFVAPLHPEFQGNVIQAQIQS